MKKRETRSAISSEVERQAADWTLKIDRGLTAREQDDYTNWLAVDRSHREAMKLCAWGWAELDRLSGLPSSRHSPIEPDLLAPGNPYARAHQIRRLVKWGAALLPAAACLLLVFKLWDFEEAKSRPTSVPVAAQEERIPSFSRIEKLNLPDGSEVELNRGARVETHYTAAERRLRLVSGEANFKVAKDPNRPFVVEVNQVTLRALGTVFNVRADAALVDLIVTEGRVKVETREVERGEESESPVVTVGQRAVVKEDRQRPRLEVYSIEREFIEQALIWQPKLLDFDAVPLMTIIEEFNRRNAIKIVVDSEEIRQISLSCSFWSDNVEGFVRLMELSFDLRAVYRDEEILLKRAEPEARQVVK
ncbi:FecR domain-containing protein [Pelagicoccus sp. SDUM812003]|uniref:FecR family protein n=1 Tax=Pelagicoccus sp. SDUM812003 TaxID=3041267 RepID=UPI00280E3725|nr:FecR domain-containing protein [Pelagicoccus sp. SDUM812003]MDQ8205523.1 FecR domain-containing protein [Pelagicoccus sp. SDUM812003]